MREARDRVDRLIHIYLVYLEGDNPAFRGMSPGVDVLPKGSPNKWGLLSKAMRMRNSHELTVMIDRGVVELAGINPKYALAVLSKNFYARRTNSEGAAKAVNMTLGQYKHNLKYAYKNLIEIFSPMLDISS